MCSLLYFMRGGEQPPPTSGDQKLEGILQQSRYSFASVGLKFKDCRILDGMNESVPNMGTAPDSAKSKVYKVPAATLNISHINSLRSISKSNFAYIRNRPRLISKCNLSVPSFLSCSPPPSPQPSPSQRPRET